MSTGLIVYDSLGNPVEVRLRLAMESRTSSGTVWRFYAESPDDSDASAVLGTGTITFDQNGQFVSATGTDVQIDRALAGGGSAAAADSLAALKARMGLKDGSGA